MKDDKIKVNLINLIEENNKDKNNINTKEQYAERWNI